MSSNLDLRHIYLVYHTNELHLFSYILLSTCNQLVPGLSLTTFNLKLFSVHGYNPINNYIIILVS